MNKTIKTTIVLFILFLSDITSKYFILNKLQNNGVYLFKFIKLDFYKNYGIAFGININQNIIIALSLIIIIILITYLQKYFKKKLYIFSLSIGLISIGAISNLADRIINGYVIDFISIWLFPVFNLSDLYILIGVIGIIFLYKKTPHERVESNPTNN